MFDIKISYFSHPRQSSGNHAPKCLPFSILCAKSVIIHTSITYNMIKTGVGVNCNKNNITTINVCVYCLKSLHIYDILKKYNQFAFGSYIVLNALFALHTNLQYKLSRPRDYPMEPGRLCDSGYFYIRGTVVANTETWVFFFFLKVYIPHIS